MAPQTLLHKKRRPLP